MDENKVGYITSYLGGKNCIADVSIPREFSNGSIDCEYLVSLVIEVITVLLHWA